MLFADNNEAVTFVRCKFVVCSHTFLPETHPHRLIACPAITGLHTGLGGQLLVRRLPRVRSLWPRMVGLARMSRPYSSDLRCWMLITSRQSITFWG